MEFVKNHKNLKILTKDGFKRFDGIRRVKNIGLKITFDNGEVLGCTKGHLIEVDGVFREASSLKVGDYIEYHKIFEGPETLGNGEVIKNPLKPDDLKADKTKIIKIEDDNELQYYYDLVNVRDGNAYLSEGFTHHNCLVVDECAFIRSESWDEFADSIFPSQEALAWKKNIIISTAKGLNHFYDIVQRAKLAEPGSGTQLVEVHWAEVPRYGPGGKLITPEEFRSKIIEKHGRAYFEQNFGNNFMGSSETLLDSDVMENLVPQSPIEELGTDGNPKNTLKIYEYAGPSRVYIMGVDSAKDGEDNFAVQIFDVTEFPFRQVASAQLQINYLEMPEFLYQWGIEYNTALMIIENNEGSGQSIADSLMNYYDYPNLHFDDGKKYPGFRMTKKTRPAILKLIQILGNAGKLGIADAATIGEFAKFEKINGKYQASDDHDDLVMALALCISPLANLDNFEDFGAFLRSLRSDEVVDTSSFLTDLVGMSFVDG